ncbi:hypothetical protein [Bradyrhizobium sp. F1.13.3]|uniref:hypothetical protein n=1 Tax=Bradyrhizobium sp. F1.13.3 TaxID=3156351 RepID=UPI00339A2AA9
MDPEQLKAFMDALDELRTGITGSVDAISKRCDAIAEDVKASRKSETAGERDRGIDGTMAERVAADGVGSAEFSVLCREVADLRKKVPRPQADLNAFADVQAKADAVMRTHNERAEPPMAGEDIVAYKFASIAACRSFLPSGRASNSGSSLRTARLSRTSWRKSVLTRYRPA